MMIASYILIAIAVGSLAFLALGILSVRRHLAPRQTPDCRMFPPVSLLKPLKGDEESLEDNLRSIFEQDYPGQLEVVFASCELDDPAILVARRLAHEYPKVPVRFVLSNPGFGLNPKVANLKGALDRARYDLVLQSDANVRLPPDYLRRVVSELEHEGASLLTSIVVGVGERSIGAALENLQLSAFIAPAMCTALHIGGVSCVVGKTMLLRRSELAELGGLETVRDILAEDFLLGQRYQRAGYKVLLSSVPAYNLNRDIGLERFFARHSRWLKMRAVIHVGGFVGDLAANPVALGTTAFALSGANSTIGWILTGLLLVKLTVDAHLLKATRGVPMHPLYLALAPIKDLFMGGIWLYSCFSRSVKWRGVKLRFGAQSRLRADDGVLPVRIARRILGLG